MLNGCQRQELTNWVGKIRLPRVEKWGVKSNKCWVWWSLYCWRLQKEIIIHIYTKNINECKIYQNFEADQIWCLVPPTYTLKSHTDQFLIINIRGSCTLSCTHVHLCCEALTGWRNVHYTHIHWVATDSTERGFCHFHIATSTSIVRASHARILWAGVSRYFDFHIAT